MNKDLKELKKFLEKMINHTEDELDEALEKALNEECTISIVKEKGNKSQIEVAGSKTTILMALAGLEKAILKELDVPAGLWETIKDRVGAEEDK